jgi:hypothetical protein
MVNIYFDGTEVFKKVLLILLGLIIIGTVIFLNYMYWKYLLTIGHTYVLGAILLFLLWLIIGTVLSAIGFIIGGAFIAGALC